MKCFNIARSFIYFAVFSITLVSSAAIGDKQDAEEEEVMALPDDVIIDVLFTNLDSIQDQVELCEEGLRQRLVEASHGQLPFVDDFDDMVSKSVSPTNNDDDDKNNSDEDDHHETNEKPTEDVQNIINKAADDQDGEDGKLDATIQHSTLVKLTHGKHTEKERKRRSADSQLQNRDGQNNNHKPEEEQHKKEDGHHDQSPPPPHHHHASATEAVVSRLSERLAYLKKSLITCYSLYRQL